MQVLLNEASSMYPFLKKAVFPSSIFFCKVEPYFKTLEEGVSYFVMASASAYHQHKTTLPEVLQVEEKNLFLQRGEPTEHALADSKKQFEASGSRATIVSFGGGAVMDLAKALKHEVGVPLVVIPTTPGTGSEVTPYSVLIDHKRVKVVRSHYGLLPEVVILDPRFLQTIPKDLLGFMVVDALAHSVEGLVSKFANPLSDALALQAIRLIERASQQAQEPGEDFFETLQVAGVLGGMVQGSASVGLAHACAHYFGPRYGIHHGAAIALFLPGVLSWNASDVKVAEKLEKASMPADDLLARIQGVLAAFDVSPPTITVRGDFDIAECATSIKKDVCMLTNPVRWTEPRLAEFIGMYVASNHS
ncbi:hypothetical protein A3I45_04025 [Candidatus Uhrbacteria bacterium RIFCSPLOWO2_02_FULL_53_10]|uniref:Uncharacterized protein n=1 Tax=Candidatus Uhrbacteria bacterium RIFCSPLOWO2_02_FULL_53_10 TaxID=1802411 RepID=A0A1F7VIG4_9BACT|nr:MAG: hypothetical protein A3I45_04025 [Candidatus Uhrbacteria bacterium RIFCSPLOWO2_02_FULL_53_10]